MLTLVDVMCPVCHEILIQPVVMPCSHGICLECFESTVEKSNLSCPMCRKRLGSWLRSATKGNQLVNVKFWEQIKKEFPDRVHAKLSGVENNEDVLFNAKGKTRHISSPGAIRKEYEAELRREEEAARKEREAEERASVEFITNIQKEAVDQRKYEEEERASEAYIQLLKKEEKLRQEEELKRALLDEQLAKDMQDMATSEVTPPGTSARKKGPMDQFLVANRSLSNLSDCSHDSIVQETHHFFRPVKVYPKTPPKKLPGGRLQEVQLVRATPRNLNNMMASLEESGDAPTTLSCRVTSVVNRVLGQLRGGHVHSSAFTGCSATDSSDEYESPRKKFRQAPHTVTSPDETASCSGVEPRPPSPGTLEQQRRAELLIQQEREDLLLARQLQKEFDASNRLVDRRKGTSRAYELRKTTDKRQTTIEEAFRTSRKARN